MIGVQAEPSFNVPVDVAALHRNHWYAYERLLPVNVPVETERIAPVVLVETPPDALITGRAEFATGEASAVRSEIATLPGPYAVGVRISRLVRLAPMNDPPPPAD